MRRFISTEYTEKEFIELLSDLLQLILSKELQKLSIPTKPAPEVEEYYTRKDLCERLHLSLPTITKLTKAGRLKAYRFGNSYRYKRTEVERFLNNQSNNYGNK